MRLLRLAALAAVASCAYAATHIVDTLLMNDGATTMSGKIYVVGPTGHPTQASTTQTITIGAAGAVDFSLLGCNGCTYRATYQLTNSRGVVYASFSEPWAVPDTTATLTRAKILDGSASPYGLINPQRISGTGLAAGQVWLWNGTAYEAAYPSESSNAGVADPGVNGVMVRTALNTSGVVAGTPTDCVLVNGTSGPCGAGGGTPGGTNGQLQVNSSGSFGGITIGGDCTLNPLTGALTCTKTSGSLFGTAATLNHPLTTAGDLYIGGAAGAPARLAAGALDTILQGGGAGAAPSFVSLTNCGDATHALAYSTSSHTWSCQAITATAAPGGSAGDIQYNNGGSMAGAAIGDCVSTGGVLQYNATSHSFSCHALGTGDIPNLSATYSIKTAGGDLSGTLPSPTVAKVNGTSIPINSAADQTIVTTASGAGAWKALADCTGAGGAMQYSTSTHAWSCHTLTATDVAAAGTLTNNTSGTAGSATNIGGGSAGQYPYQTGPSTTGFRTANVANGPVVLDGSGNVPIALTAPGFTTSYTGVAQIMELKQGTTPASPGANSFQFRAPTSIPTSYYWTVPSADASGCLKSDGAGTMSIGACGTGGASYAYHAYTGTSAVDLATYNAVLVTASGGNPTVTVSAAPSSSGAPVAIGLCNDGTARTWTLPATFKRILPPMIASTCTYTAAVYDGTNYQGPGSDETASILRYTAERADPGTGNCPNGGCDFVDSTAHNRRFRSSADVVYAPVRTSVDVNPDTGQVTATHLAAALPLAQGGTALAAVPGSSGQYLYNNGGAFGAKAIPATDIPNVPVTISTSGPVADPGGANVYLFNNAASALTFNAPAGVAGLQRCYRNATGKSGAITIQMAASNTVDVDGANGTAAGTLVSAGALGDSVCIVSDAANHWYAYKAKGTWTNN